MKRYNWYIFLLAIIMMVLLTAGCAGSGANQDIVSTTSPIATNGQGVLPILSIGDKWSYRNTGQGLEKIWIYEVVGSDTVNGIESYVERVLITDVKTKSPPWVAGSGASTLWIDKSTMQLIRDEQTNEAGSVFTRQLSYNFRGSPLYPLQVGKEHKWVVTHSNDWTGKTIRGSFDQLILVEGKEDVTVPAGTFECFRVDTYIGGVLNNTMWYSDKVKSFVKKTWGDQQFVLESYSLAEPGQPSRK